MPGTLPMPKHGDDRLAQRQARIHVRSLPEITEGCEQTAMQFYYDTKIHVRGRRPKQEAVVNAVLLHFLSLPVADQYKILMEKIPEFERRCQTEPAQPERGQLLPPAPPPPPGQRRPKNGK